MSSAHISSVCYTLVISIRSRCNISNFVTNNNPVVRKYIRQKEVKGHVIGLHEGTERMLVHWWLLMKLD